MKLPHQSFTTYCHTSFTWERNLYNVNTLNVSLSCKKESSIMLSHLIWVSYTHSNEFNHPSLTLAPHLPPHPRCNQKNPTQSICPLSTEETNKVLGQHLCIHLWTTLPHVLCTVFYLNLPTNLHSGDHYNLIYIKEVSEAQKIFK